MLPQSSPLALRIANFASRRHGIVDLDELERAGVSRSTVKLWARSGRLFRLHRSVFSIVPPSMLTIEGRWLAAVKALGPGRAVLSHGPAGQLGGIVPRRMRFALNVSVADRIDRRPPGIVVHRPRRLEPSDTTTRLAIPTTTITRTIWDLATTLPPQQTRRAFEQARSRDLLDERRLAELLTTSPSRKGSALVRTLLGERIVPLAEVRSWLEDLLLTICADHALPFPAVNVPLLGYEVDFLWASARFVVEADGRDHEIPRQRDADNERDFVLQRAGFLVRRYSSKAMDDEASVATEIVGILRERARLR